MGGIFGVVSKKSCTLDVFFGVDYHSHLGTKRGGMAVYGPRGFSRAIHNIENTPFRTKFDGDLDELEGTSGIEFLMDFWSAFLIFRRCWQLLEAMNCIWGYRLYCHREVPFPQMVGLIFFRQ